MLAGKDAKITFENFSFFQVLVQHFNINWNMDIRCHIWPCFFSCLQITKSDLRPYIKWAISLVIAAGHLILLKGLCGYAWVNMLTLSPPALFEKSIS